MNVCLSRASRERSVSVVHKRMSAASKMASLHTQRYTAIKTCETTLRENERRERRRRDPLSHWQQWDGVERYEDETPSASEE